MHVYLCEKPSQARDLAAVLRVTGGNNAQGYIGNERVAVTWAYGHMVTMYMPEQYDEQLKSWSLETLPIIPDQWKSEIKPAARKQFNNIKRLLQKADHLYISTDYDREGESIARELMAFCGYKGPTTRICLRALDPASIQKALNNPLEGNASLPLYYEAMARQRADWLVGMNFSRLYTVIGRKFMNGANHTFHIGRVITPTINLVCERDRAINTFVPSPYYLLDIQISAQNGNFWARWVPPEDRADEHGRCLDKNLATAVAAAVAGKPGSITRADEKKASENAPLPFGLTSLQVFADRKYGYSAQEVLDAAQALYETHKLTSYPRSDCRYLPESQHADAAEIFASLIQMDSEFAGAVAGAEPDRKSRAFSDKSMKDSPHNAIIPTAHIGDLSKLSNIEMDIYDCIRRQYIAQFYAPFVFMKTDIEATVGNHTFAASGRVPHQQGWRVLFSNPAHQDEENEQSENSDEGDDQLTGQGLPKVAVGEQFQTLDTQSSDKLTRPPPHYTNATLLQAMENVARFIDEPRFKAILKETAGLGTTATRASILENAITRGYLIKKKRVLLASDKAYALVDMLPTLVKSAGLTATWEQELSRIGAGETTLKPFMLNITGWVTKAVTSIIASLDRPEVQSVLSAAVSELKEPEADCFACGGNMRRIRSKKNKSYFWACQSDLCDKTYPDKAGNPVNQDAVDREAPACGDCGRPMRLRKGKKAGAKRQSSFWGCSGYPDCKATAPYKSASGR